MRNKTGAFCRLRRSVLILTKKPMIRRGVVADWLWNTSNEIALQKRKEKEKLLLNFNFTLNGGGGTKRGLGGEIDKEWKGGGDNKGLIVSWRRGKLQIWEVGGLDFFVGIGREDWLVFGSLACSCKILGRSNKGFHLLKKKEKQKQKKKK